MRQGYPAGHDKGSIRIIMAFAMCILILAGAVFLVILPSVEHSLLERKKESIRDLLQSACSQLAWFENEVMAGRMDRKEAQRKAADQLSHLSYGTGGEGYVWINNLDARLRAPEKNTQGV